MSEAETGSAVSRIREASKQSRLAAEQVEEEDRYEDLRGRALTASTLEELSGLLDRVAEAIEDGVEEEDDA